MGNLCPRSTYVENSEQYAVKTDATPVWSRIHDDSVFCLASCPIDGAVCSLSAGEDRKIVLFDWDKQTTVHQWADHARCINSLAVSPQNAQLFYSASRDCTVRCWNLTQPACAGVLTGHTLSVSAVTVSGDGTLLAWAVATTACVYGTLQHSSSCMSVRFRAISLRVCAISSSSNSDSSGGGGGGGGGDVCCCSAEDLRVRLWDTRAMLSPTAVIENQVVYLPVRPPFGLSFVCRIRVCLFFSLVVCVCVYVCVCVVSFIALL